MNPSRATPPNFVGKIPGSHQHDAGWGLTCLPSNAMVLLVLIYTWVGWSLVNLKQGAAQPKLPQFGLWLLLNLQPLTQEPITIPLHHQGSTCICAHVKPNLYLDQHPQGVCTGTLDGLVGSHTRLAIYPALTICCQRVVICASLNTSFKGM